MPDSPDNHSSPNWLKTKVSNWFWSLTPSCREVVRLTSEERENRLPFAMRWRLGLHRCFCKWCARYAKQLDLLHEASRLYPEHADESSDAALSEDARTRMKRALQRQPGTK